MVTLFRLRQALLLLCFALTLTPNAKAWNALGHRLVAQIAYHHLTPEAKKLYNRYNHALDGMFRPQSFVNAAAWLDRLTYLNQRWLGEMHYIAQPFSRDNTALIPPQKMNAVSAILQSITLMKKPGVDNYTRGFTLRILLHVVGDIHQPLHAANQFSKTHPEGDKGGNLLLVRNQGILVKLHAFWDRGGGWLANKSYTQAQLNRKAYWLEKQWPCHLEEMNLDPHLWAEESFNLAVNKAYTLEPGQKISREYKAMTQAITEERIAKAGCRLAALLNNLATAN